jgi:hypothetical protein
VGISQGHEGASCFGVMFTRKRKGRDGMVDLDRQGTLESYRISPSRVVSIMTKNQHDGKMIICFPSRRHCLEGECCDQRQWCDGFSRQQE